MKAADAREMPLDSGRRCRYNRDVDIGVWDKRRQYWAEAMVP